VYSLVVDIDYDQVVRYRSRDNPVSSQPHGRAVRSFGGCVGLSK
jgi:hypothetical protein